MTQQKRPWVQRCATDAILLERTGLDEFTLRRLRKALHSLYGTTGGETRRSITEGGTPVRFALMVSAMAVAWSPEQRSAWYAYLQHDERNIREMCAGLYPIGPYDVRVMSALFGIKVDYLLLGTAPTPDRLGANIDRWPMAQTTGGGTT